MNTIYNPWKDITPYTTDDVHSFKGRDEEKRYFIKMIENADFTVLYAESGIGKTSFINAGLYPEFKKNGYECIRIIFPTELLTSSHNNPHDFFENWFYEQIIKGLSKDNDNLSVPNDEYADQILEKSLWWNLHSQKFHTKPFLIFDQFEEVFQKANKDNLKAIFSIIEELTGERPPANIIEALVKAEDRGIFLSYSQGFNYKILFSLRKEYLAEFDYWTNEVNSISQLLRNRMLLLPFSELQAREVITQQTHNGNRVTIFDNVVNDILSLFRNRNNKGEQSGKYEAFLLSVICSRLYLLSQNSAHNNLTSEDVRAIDLDKLLIDFYDERITQIGIPKKHLRVIENLLVDPFGERNRVNVNTQELYAINFKTRYEKPLENVHLIRWSANGYVELIHDKIAELINQRRKQKRLQSWNVVQRIGICLYILLSFVLLTRLGWSSSSQYDIGYVTLEKKQKTVESYKAIWPNNFPRRTIDGSNYFINNLSSTRILEIKLPTDRDQLICIYDCPVLEEIRISGKAKTKCSIKIENCESLCEISISDSLNIVPSIKSCPKVHSIRLPENFDNDINVTPSGHFVIDVPQKIQDHYRWSDGILWNLKDRKICFTSETPDTVIMFPQELHTLKEIKHHNKIIINGVGRNEPYYRINGSTLEKVNLFDMKDVKLDLRNNESTKDIRRIGKEAFANCKELVSVVLPDSLYSIDESAFFNCSNLEKIQIPESLSIINCYAFYGCKIDSLILPKKLKRIGNAAFSMCTNLKYVSLPSNQIPDISKKSADTISYSTIFDGCYSINAFNRNDSTFRTDVCSIKNGDTYLYFSNSISSPLYKKDSTLYYKNIAIVHNGIKQLSSVGYTYNPDTLVHIEDYAVGIHNNRCHYWHQFRNNISYIKEVHTPSTNPNDILGLPNLISRNCVLYVPYHCRKNYILRYGNDFKVIKEDSLTKRIKNQYKNMFDATFSTFKQLGVLSYISVVLIVLFVLSIIYRKLKRHLPRIKALAKSITSIVCFIIIWIAIYWPIFFLWTKTGIGGTNSGYIGIVLGLLIGIIVAFLLTWMLVFDTKTDAFVMLSQFWLNVRAITGKDIKDEFVKRIIYVKQLMSSTALWIKHRVILSIVLLSAIIIATALIASIRCNETIIKKDNLSPKDIQKLSLSIIRTKKQKDCLSELICNNLKISNVEEMILPHWGHSSRVNDIAFSPDGNYFASGSDDGTVKLWSTNDNKEIKTFKHGACVKSVSFSRDNNTILSTSSDGTAKIWDVSNGTLIDSKDHKYDNALFSSFSPDGNLAVTASKSFLGSEIILWNTSNWNSVAKFEIDNRLNSIQFSNNSKLIVLSQGNYASIYDITTNKIINNIQHDDDVNSAVFSHNDELLLTTTDDGVYLWNILENRIIYKVTKEQIGSGRVKSATFIQGDSQILIYDIYGDIKIITLGDKIEVRNEDRGILLLGVDNKQKRIATSNSYGKIIMWDINNCDKPIWESVHTYNYGVISFPKENITILKQIPECLKILKTNSLANKYELIINPYSVSNEYIVGVDADNVIKLVKTKSGQEIWTLNSIKNKRINSLSFTRKTILAHCYDSTYIISINNGNIINQYRNEFLGATDVISPQGNLMAAFDYYRDTVEIRDFNGKIINKLYNNKDISLAFSQDEKYLWSIQRDTIKKWDIYSGKIEEELINNGKIRSQVITLNELIVSNQFAIDTQTDTLIKLKKYVNNFIKAPNAPNTIFDFYGNNIYKTTINDIKKEIEPQCIYRTIKSIEDLSVIDDKRFIYISEDHEAIVCRVLSLRELIKKAKQTTNETITK